MKTPTLLTTKRMERALILMDGDHEIGVVFGSHYEQDQRAAELISAANYARLIRTKNNNQKKEI